MFFPEQLYLLSARDLQVSWLDPLLRRVTDSQNAVQVAANFTTGIDRILILQSVHGAYSPGAGQNIVDADLSIKNPQGNFGVRLRTLLNALGAGVTAELTWQGSLLVPPGWFLSAFADFNAGVAPNNVELSVAGIIIPRANVQGV